MFPTLLVPDGSFMIDRRMGVYGYPLEIQALFYAALQVANELLLPERRTRHTSKQRRFHIAYHVRNYYWLDLDGLNKIYRYGVEEFASAMNWLNIYPATIQIGYEWLSEKVT